LVESPEPDEFEDIRVVTKEIPEVIDMILKGEMTHSIIIASILLALPSLGFHLPRK
jgi:hypothetical protein